MNGRSGLSRRQVMRTGLVALGALAGSATLAACQTTMAPQVVKETVVVEKVVEATSEPVTIRIQAPANTLDVKKYYEELVYPRFREKYPEIEVTMELAPWGEIMDKQKLELAAGNAADCFLNDNLYSIEYAERGVLRELTPYFEQDADEFKSKVAGWQSGFNVDGKCWAMPRGCHTATTVYNKKLFEKAGMEPPSADLAWNPDDGGTFLEQLMALTVDSAGNHPSDSGFDPTDIQQWGYISQNYGSVDHWPRTVSNGGTWMDETRTQSRLNSTETAGALKFAIDMIQKYHVSPTAEEQAAYTIAKTLPAFCAGKVGMVHMLYGHQPGLSEPSEDFEPVALKIESGPAGPLSTLFEHHLFVYIGSQHPNEAWLWIRNHILDVEVQVGAVTVSHYQLPVHKEALADPRLLEPQTPLPADISPWVNVALEGTGRDWELNAVFLDFWVQLHKSMDYGLQGQMTPEEAIEDAHTQCQAILDRRYAQS